MKIWALPVTELDDRRLLGEHAELHTVYATITRGYRAWSKHPETIRFMDRVGELVYRHREQVEEMHARGFAHHSPLADPPPEAPYRYATELERRDRRLLRSRGGGRPRAKRRGPA